MPGKNSRASSGVIQRRGGLTNTEPMALATGFDFATIYQSPPEPTAQENRLFHQPNVSVLG